MTLDNLSEVGFLNTAYQFILVYLGGIAVSFTPCIYPILPIVIGYLGNKDGSIGYRIRVTLSYALGLASVYALLGIVSALTGNIFGDLTTSMYSYLFFGIITLLMGGAMMDWYQLPQFNFSPSKSAGVFNRKSFFAPFLFGATSGTVTSPCTAPVLATILTYVATQKSVLKGGLLLFVFAMGMNTLIIAIGISMGLMGKMARSGSWMVWIKKILATILLVGGLYFIFKAGELS